MATMAKAKMKKKRKNSQPDDRVWHSIDLQLKRINDIDLKIDGYETDKNKKVMEIESKAKAKIDKLQERRKVYDERIVKYLNGMKDEFKKKRSRNLPFGKVGWRHATWLEILPGFTEDEVIDNLLKAGKMNFVRKTSDKLAESKFVKTERSLKRRELANSDLTDDELLEVGVKRCSEDRIWYATKKELMPDLNKMENENNEHN